MELRDSIQQKQLLHPPVFMEITNPDGTTLYQLIAGERRVRAIQSLAEEGLPFLYAGEEYPPGELPATVIPMLSRLEKRELEFDENELRLALSWQDKTRALAMLHELRKEQNPQQTKKDTANEIMATQNLPDTSQSNVYRAVRIATVVNEFLDDPVVAAARNETEAYQLALQQESARFEAELARRRKVRATGQSIRCDIRVGSAFDILPKLDPQQFDLILTDPPYGIGAGQAGYRARTVHHHNYEDSADYAREVLQFILTEGWRVTKLRANIFIFTDIKHFDWLQGASTRMGWVPWRTPVIWRKSASEGLVPWGRHGFAHTYDIIFWATKGRRGLNAHNVDVLDYPRVARKDRVYGAEKPVPLLKRIIELTTVPADSVLDPCVGSGSTLVAAKQLARHSEIGRAHV